MSPIQNCGGGCGKKISTLFEFCGEPCHPVEEEEEIIEEAPEEVLEEVEEMRKPGDIDDEVLDFGEETD